MPRSPRPLPSNQRRSLLAIGVTGLLAAGCASPPREEPVSNIERLVDAGGHAVEITFATDRLGVVAPDADDAADLEPLAERFGLHPIAEHPRGVFVCGLPEARPWPEIVELARQIRGERPDLVRHAGVVASVPGAETPLVVTGELIVQFQPAIGRDRVGVVTLEEACGVIRANPFVPGQYLLAVTAETKASAFEVCRRLEGRPEVRYAEPDLVPVVEYRQEGPDDPLFFQQWHHDNTGQNGGTPDADVDTLEAWAITRGGGGVVIAVIDDGFDAGHPDLVPNLWINDGERAGDGADDDGNGFVDDVHGWDFANDDHTLGGGVHGTAVAGCAAARGGNGRGVAGSCPEGRLMLLRNGASAFTQAMAFDYARVMGADVITNSWGYAIGSPLTRTVENAIRNAATIGRDGLGCVVFFAMNNADRNDCAGPRPDISSLDEVVAVSASSNLDRKVTESASGTCLDLLGPTHRGYGRVPFTGTLNVATTDVTGPGGYNDGGGAAPCPQPEPDDQAYTFCFGGTSAATPIVAGVAALAVDAGPDLDRVQVQRLLQDTADRIEDSAGEYAALNGFSGPATHGHGRVNAWEAVRVAAETDAGGRGGVDLLVRDNRLDWGNTEQPSHTLFEPVRGLVPHWLSQDIKLDAPPFAPTMTTPLQFETFRSERLVAEAVNRAYVRIRNRGPLPAESVIVSLLWARAGGAAPNLPEGFWDAFPADAGGDDWHVIGTRTIDVVEYSGPSVAGTGEDAAQVVMFEFEAPPEVPVEPDPCFLLLVDSPDDPIAPESRATLVVDQIVPRDNNVTLLAMHRVQSGLRILDERLVLHNPYDEPIEIVVRLFKPPGWVVVVDRVSFDQVIRLSPRERLAAGLQMATSPRRRWGRITVVQERVAGATRSVMGGVTFQVRPPGE